MAHQKKIALDLQPYAISSTAQYLNRKRKLEETYMNWYFAVLRNYAGFSGRARRKEYWMFLLFHIIFLVIAIILDNMLGLAFKDLGYGPIYLIYTVAVLIPALAVAIRRLHDTGRSGWYILISLIPFIGSLILLVFFASAGDVDDNEYGSDPKQNEMLGDR